MACGLFQFQILIWLFFFLYTNCLANIRYLHYFLTFLHTERSSLFHSDQPKLRGVLAGLSAIGLDILKLSFSEFN